MKRIFVTPLDGKVIPLPDGNGDLPQAGKEVTASSFWYRREKDLDVSIEPAQPAQIQSTEPKETGEEGSNKSTRTKK